MLITTGARANGRALACGLAFGAAAGVVLGGAYVAGDTAQRADSRVQVQHLAGAAAQGFSDLALRGETAAMDPGALAVAERHDPFTAAGDAQRDHEATLFVAETFPRAPISNATGPNGLQNASYAAPTNPEARPFHLQGGAMDSSRDLDCLADAVYYEARGETPAGQAAVAQVVLNRVRHPAFPKSVCGVVFQGAQASETCQFSFACDGSMDKPREPVAWKRARTVAAHALAGFVMPSVGNATHFHVVGLDPGWGPRLLRVAQIGLHVFYRFGGYAGAPGAFTTAHVQRSAPGSEVAMHPVYASMLPVGETTTADGRPSGQYILASATLTADGAKPVAAPPTQAPSPVVAANTVAHDAAVIASASRAATTASHADQPVKGKADAAAAGKPETTASAAKPLTLAAAS